MFVHRKHMYFLFFHTNPGSSFLALLRDMVFPWDARLVHAIAIYLICILIRTLYVTMYWTNIKIFQRITFNLIFNLHFILYSCILKEIKAIRLFKSSGIFFFLVLFVLFFVIRKIIDAYTFCVITYTLFYFLSSHQHLSY